MPEYRRPFSAFLSAVVMLCAALTQAEPSRAGQATSLRVGDQSTSASQSSPPRGEVLRIHFSGPGQLAQLAGRLDVWDVRRTEGYAIAYVNPAERDWLGAAGFAVEDEPLLTTHADAIPGYPCYQTIDELYARAATWAAQYPNLVELRRLPQRTYEGRELVVLLVTNRAQTIDKPAFFLMANVHGRELVTPETAMAFVEQLLQGYGADADSTWLLDYRQLHVLISANPDGHVRNEPGQPWIYWRKNTRPYGSCALDSLGVDLNRNSGFRWGWDDEGSSPEPCADTYRGPSAVSEDETAAVEAYVRTVLADQRGPEDGDAAPADATGIFVSLHSFGNYVLWPWGWTNAMPPNAVELRRLGEKLATFNGYYPGQAGQALYLTNGTTDDWAYGELGVAAYTFEIGSAADGFYPGCDRRDALIGPNLAALRYALRVARAPYQEAYGPDVRDIQGKTVAAMTGATLEIRASIDNFANSGTPLVGAEATIDLPPWAAGATAHPLAPLDGAWDTPGEVAWTQVPAMGLAPGRHTVFVRGREAGQADRPASWGPVFAAFIEIGNATPHPLHLPLVPHGTAGQTRETLSARLP